MPFKILCVAGARPNFMKIAPLLRAFRGRSELDARLVHTGQHYDAKLSKIFFEDLKIPKPDVELEVGSGSHAGQTAEVMKRFEAVLESEQPHAVLVVGDVNSTIACALVTSKFQRKEAFSCVFGSTGAKGKAPTMRRRPLMIHVEAGLRSFDDDMPEEVNRKLTDAISELLFVSDPAGMENLAREGVSPDRVFFVGNVMIDTLLAAKDMAMESPILEQLGVEAKKYGLVTLHRPSNVDDPEMLRTLLSTLDEVAKELRIVFPVHPRTRQRLASMGLTLDTGRWLLTEPVGYVDFMKLQAMARLVLTDSGGVQEETTVLGVRCVTLRENTERPATITEGTNVLAGTDRAKILAAAKAQLAATGPTPVPRFWDGQSAERIADELVKIAAP